MTEHAETEVQQPVQDAGDVQKLKEAKPVIDKPVLCKNTWLESNYKFCMIRLILNTYL